MFDFKAPFPAEYGNQALKMSSMKVSIAARFTKSAKISGLPELPEIAVKTGASQVLLVCFHFEMSVLTIMRISDIWKRSRDFIE